MNPCMAIRNLHVDSTNDLLAIDHDANIRFSREAICSGAKNVILMATFEGRDSTGSTEFSNANETAVDAIGGVGKAP